jgi:hypothetical protein
VDKFLVDREREGRPRASPPLLDERGSRGAELDAPLAVGLDDSEVSPDALQIPP